MAKSALQKVRLLTLHADYQFGQAIALVTKRVNFSSDVFLLWTLKRPLLKRVIISDNNTSTNTSPAVADAPEEHSIRRRRRHSGPIVPPPGTQNKSGPLIM